MIKRILIAMAVCLLFCTFAIAEEGLTIWGVGASEITGLRVGYQWNNFEVGGLTYWDEDNDFREALGGYVFYTLPGEFDPNDIGWLPNDIQTVNYLGIQGTLDIDGDDEDSGFFGPTFGMVLKKFIVPSSNELIKTVVEVQYINYYGDLEDRIDTGDEVRLMFGMKIQF